MGARLWHIPPLLAGQQRETLGLGCAPLWGTIPDTVLGHSTALLEGKMVPTIQRKMQSLRNTHFVEFLGCRASLGLVSKTTYEHISA